MGKHEDFRDRKDIGVYLMTNKKNGSRYVGASFSLAYRISYHRRQIANRRVDRLNNKYFACFAWCSPDDLEFAILERVTFGPGVKKLSDAKRFLRDREHHWIHELKPEANTNDSPTPINLRFDRIEIPILGAIHCDDVPKRPAQERESKTINNEFSVYYDSSDDRQIVLARSHAHAARIAADARGWPISDVVVRYRRTVEGKG